MESDGHTIKPNASAPAKRRRKVKHRIEDED
jgi:hypothetical protein